MNINTITVVGANGTMGRNVSAIFAAFGNAKVYMISRSIDKSIVAEEKAYQTVRAESIKSNMIPADYTMLEKCIQDSDLVFESTVENLDIKLDITRRIAACAKPHTIFCTGTSGLSITTLAECFPEAIRQNYMGIHMYNPPYNMILCEMIPTKYNDMVKFNKVKDYLSNVLRRTVVVVKDSPAFLGNRIGFQFINEALQYAELYKFNGGIDFIDAILGPFTGRAMAPLVTANFVGLDVHRAIVDNLYANTNDYAHASFLMPEFAVELVNKGYLGRKTGGGLYKTIFHDNGVKLHHVFDLETRTYRDVIKYSFPFVETMIKSLRVGDYASAFKTLINNHSLEAEICIGFLLRYVIYSLSSADLVADSIQSADDVMAAGFSWCPPLAIIQALFGKETFKQLAMERLDASMLNRIDIDKLLIKADASRYDFRKFVKAKH